MNIILSTEEFDLLSRSLSVVAAYRRGEITNIELEAALIEFDLDKLQRISNYVASKYAAQQE